MIILGHTEAPEENFSGAKAGKTTLQQIKSNEGGQPKPIAAVIARARWHTER
jgi:hypothetical protein